MNGLSILKGFRGPPTSNSNYGSPSSKGGSGSTKALANDPVSMHLLMETAIIDSKQYNVLQPDQLDSAKRELTSLSSRIESSKRKLALEQKVRDAAQSIDRLPSRPESRSKSSASIGRTGEEAMEAAKKCEELSLEIGRMEREEQVLQKELLEHTAGVLQLTHKGYLKADPTGDDLLQGNPYFGLDGQGEFGGLGQYALYTQILDSELQGRSTSDLKAQHEIVLGVERKVEQLNARLRNMILEMKPPKNLLPHPARLLEDDPNEVEQILVEQVDFLEKCLDAMHQLSEAHKVGAATEKEELGHLILGYGHRIEQMNVQLRDTILTLKPRKELLPTPPKQLQDDPNNPEKVLVEQTKFLGRCLASLQDILDDRKEIGQAEFVEIKLSELNAKLHEIMTEHDPAKAASYQSPPVPGRETVQDQVIYLDQGLNAVDRRVGQLAKMEHQLEDINIHLYEAMMEHGNPEKKQVYQPPPDGNGHTLDDQYLYTSQGIKVVEKRLDELAGIADTSSTRLKQFEARADQYISVVGGLWDILTHDEVGQARAANPSAPVVDNFTLTGFSHKVQELHNNHTSLQDQKNVLVRQLQQQRDLKGDPAKDQELACAQDQVESLKQQLKVTSDEAANHMERLTNALTELESVKEMANNRNAQTGSERASLEEQLRMQTALCAKSEASCRDFESEIVRLQTELTIAKADLDGARGTRAQRAAEAAADPALQARVQTLQQELSETIADYESMTKATIEHEKEREQLESTCDGLRERVEELETRIAEDRITSMGMRSPGGDSVRSTHGYTSVAVLKTEFKKMMRETKTEHSKVLKVSLKMLVTMMRLLTVW